MASARWCDLLLVDKARQQDQARSDEAAGARLHRMLVEEDYNKVQGKKTLGQLAIKALGREAAEQELRDADQARGKIEPTFS
jgi:hypothetical protein